MDLGSIAAGLTALAAIATAVAAFIRTIQNRSKMDEDKQDLVGYVNVKTNGLHQQGVDSLNARFDDLSRKMQIDMQDRITRELKFLRAWYEKVQKEE